MAKAVVLSLLILFLFSPVDVSSFDYGSIPPSKRWSNWKPPGPRDHRGPCPALNILANHGYINRNGTNLKPKDVAKAIFDVYGTSEILAEAVAWVAVFTVGNSTRKDFSLGEYGLTERQLGYGLTTHGALEHDCSLTREDAYIGKSRTVSHRLFSQFITTMAKMGKTEVDADVIAAHMGRRHADSLNRNPAYNYNFKDRFVQFFEAALVAVYFTRNGAAPVSWMQSVFLFERLPEDYVRRNDAEDMAVTGQMFVDLYKKQSLPIKDGFKFPTTAAGFACAFLQFSQFLTFVPNIKENLAANIDLSAFKCTEPSKKIR